MVYDSVDALANGVASKYGSMTRQKAISLVQKWAKLLENVLKDSMRTSFYMPYAPKVYARTGQIFNHVEITYKNTQLEATANIHYTDYPSRSFLNGGSGWNVMRILEHGYTYSPKMPAWMKHVPYCGFRPGQHLLEHVANSWKGLAAGAGVTITYSG